MGGEKRIELIDSCIAEGSPPRGRGKADSFSGIHTASGITPAWAGKSFSSAMVSRISWDHPRVGGEKAAAALTLHGPVGSPPRGRGKAIVEEVIDVPGGITPAWAGKRSPVRAGRSRSQDHPRVGGEKQARDAYDEEVAGSPPRGRGKVNALLLIKIHFWITPAWAGKRLKRSHRSGIFISGPIPFHSVLHRPAGSGGSRAGRDGSPAGQPQNTGPA